MEAAVRGGDSPSEFAWPASRRSRAQVRITLRRLARSDPGSVANWRRCYDRIRDEDAVEEAALHS